MIPSTTKTVRDNIYTSSIIMILYKETETHVFLQSDKDDGCNTVHDTSLDM